MSGLHLQHYQEFQEVLKHYRVSDRGLKALEDLPLVLMLAPTSSGRNTIIRQLVSTGGYHYIVSDTTRPPRINDGIPERNGQEYWFRSEEEMLADLRAGEYLEAELIHDQQVSGISIRELEAAKKEQKVAVTDIDLEGVRNILRVKPDTFAVMLVPPSFDEWQRRITQRGRMSEQEYARRLQTADRIFEEASKENYYHFVISENVQQSIGIINGIIKGQSNPHQDRGRDLVKNLQESLRQKSNSPY
jgi:guanylate kinase